MRAVSSVAWFQHRGLGQQANRIVIFVPLQRFVAQPETRRGATFFRWLSGLAGTLTGARRIVISATFRVTQDFIRLSYARKRGLHFTTQVGAALMKSIRMKVSRQIMIHVFNLVARGDTRNTKHFVMVLRLVEAREQIIHVLLRRFGLRRSGSCRSIDRNRRRGRYRLTQRRQVVAAK